MTPISNTTKRGRGRPRLSECDKKHHFTLRLSWDAHIGLRRIMCDLGQINYAKTIEAIVAFLDPLSEFNDNQCTPNRDEAERRMEQLGLLKFVLVKDVNGLGTLNPNSVNWSGSTEYLRHIRAQQHERYDNRMAKVFGPKSKNTAFEFTALHECVIREEFRA